jgi:hypothetical protein
MRGWIRYRLRCMWAETPPLFAKLCDNADRTTVGNCAQWITVVEALASRHTRRSVGNVAARSSKEAWRKKGADAPICGQVFWMSWSMEGGPELSSANLRNLTPSSKSTCRSLSGSGLHRYTFYARAIVVRNEDACPWHLPGGADRSCALTTPRSSATARGGCGSGAKTRRAARYVSTKTSLSSTRRLWAPFGAPFGRMFIPDRASD